MKSDPIAHRKPMNFCKSKLIKSTTSIPKRVQTAHYIDYALITRENPTESFVTDGCSPKVELAFCATVPGLSDTETKEHSYNGWYFFEHFTCYYAIPERRRLSQSVYSSNLSGQCFIRLAKSLPQMINDFAGLRNNRIRPFVPGLFVTATFPSCAPSAWKLCWRSKQIRGRLRGTAFRPCRPIRTL